MSRVLGRPPLAVAVEVYTAGRDLQFPLHRRRAAPLLSLRVRVRMWHEAGEAELPVVWYQVEDKESTEAGHTDDVSDRTGWAGGERLMRERAGDAGKGFERGDAEAAP